MELDKDKTVSDDYQVAVRLLETLQARYTKDIYNDKVPFHYVESEWVDLNETLKEKWEIRQGSAEDRQLQQYKEKIKGVQPITQYESPVYQNTIELALNRIRLILPRSDAEMIDYLVVGSAPTGRFNGALYRVPDNRYGVVLLEDGVFHIIHMLAKILAAATPSKNIFGVRRKFNRINADETLSSKPELSLRYGNLMASIVCYGSSYKSKPYVLPREDTLVQSKLVAVMQLFVVSHEVAHWVLGHEATANPDQSIKNEVEADSYAIDVTVRYALLSGIETEFVFSAMHSLFHFLSLLESAFTKYDAEISQKREFKRHPHPSQRAEIVRQALNQIIERRRQRNKAVMALGYYAYLLGKISETSEIMMEAVSNQFNASPHRKWYQ